MRSILFILVVIFLAACQQAPKHTHSQVNEVVVFKKTGVSAPVTPEPMSEPEVVLPQVQPDPNAALKKEYQDAINGLGDDLSLSDEPVAPSGEQSLIYLEDSENLQALEFGYLEQGWIFDPKSRSFMDEELIKQPILKAILGDIDLILVQVNKMESHSQRSFVTALTSVAVILRSTVSDAEKQKQAVAAVALILDLAKMVGKAMPNVYEAMPTSGAPEEELDLAQAQRVIELIAFNTFSPMQIKMIGD